MSDYSLEDTKQIIQAIDKELVRLQYNIAIYKVCYDHSGKPKQLFADRLNGTQSAIIVDHILLIAIQDAILTICRMFDNSHNSQSFVRLQNLRGKSKDDILLRAAGNYKDTNYDFDISNLRQEYIDEIEIAWRRLGKNISEVLNSKQFKKLSLLRNDTLAHSLSPKKTNRPEIKDIYWVFNKIPKLLDLSYRVFLDTDYQSNFIYEIAEKDAIHFWEQLIPEVKNNSF